MNSPVSQIKERLTIEEVVSSYIKLERVGSNLKAKCPFHNEKHLPFYFHQIEGVIIVLVVKLKETFYFCGRI